MMHSLLRPLAAAMVLVAFATLPAGAQTLLDKAREAVRDAGETIEDAARDAGRDASDFLADNPDLNRDILHAAGGRYLLYFRRWNIDLIPRR